jgi:hypothetical protein
MAETGEAPAEDNTRPDGILKCGSGTGHQGLPAEVLALAEPDNDLAIRLSGLVGVISLSLETWTSLSL